MAWTERAWTDGPTGRGRTGSTWADGTRRDGHGLTWTGWTDYLHTATIVLDTATILEISQTIEDLCQAMPTCFGHVSGILFMFIFVSTSCLIPQTSDHLGVLAVLLKALIWYFTLDLCIGTGLVAPHV